MDELSQHRKPSAACTGGEVRCHQVWMLLAEGFAVQYLGIGGFLPRNRTIAKLRMAVFGHGLLDALL